MVRLGPLMSVHAVIWSPPNTIADDVAHVDDHDAAAGEQHEIEVVVAAIAVGHEHVAQVVGGTRGDARHAARIAPAQHPGATPKNASSATATAPMTISTS